MVPLYGFSRKSRLVSKQDFQSVFANPRKISRQYFTVLYQLNHLPHARLGIIIGKQHVKLSVDRNRLRRVIRESFRHHQDQVSGLDIVVIVRGKVLRDDINQLWQLFLLP